MSLNLRESIAALRTEIIEIAVEVQHMYIDATRMFLSLTTNGAQAVADKRADIEQRTAQFEESCNKVLALHQPVAKDLRLILIYFKLASDLERLGSLAARIGKKAVRIPEVSSISVIKSFDGQVEKVEWMLDNCISMIKKPDAALAIKISAMNIELKAGKGAFREHLENQIIESKEQARVLINTLGVFRHLVRIADLTSDITSDFAEH